VIGVERVKNSDAAFYRSDVVTHSDVKTAEIARAAHQLAALNSKFLAKFHYGTDGNDRIVDMELSDDLVENLYDALVDGHEKLVQEKKKQDERIRHKFNEFQVNKIKRVKYDKPWTIVWWADGDITRSKCAENDVWSESAGFNACVVKHYFQTTGAYNKVLKTYCTDVNNDKVTSWQDGYDTGYADGREDGYDEGREDGYDEGFEDGKTVSAKSKKEMNFED
jgi:hypothetical protein